MPFWNRDHNETQLDVSYIEQTANQAQQDLASGEDLRRSIAVDMMLKWLWNPDAARSRALYRVFGAPGFEAYSYDRFLQTLSLSKGDEPPAAPFPIVAESLSDLLTEYLVKERTPFGERENFIPNRVILDNAIFMVGRLQIYEAHTVICRLLAAANYRLQKRGQGPGTGHSAALNPEVDARSMVRLTTDCLLRLPPDRIPDYWAKLKVARTEGDMRPVVARMRDRRAVPFMLEALPHLEEDGQADVIVALGNIKDTRAIPALQEFASRHTKLVGPLAANALADILRTSHDDSAQLLRPTDSRHGGNAAEALLRAAAPSPDAQMHADQLLRPGDRPPEETKEPLED